MVHVDGASGFGAAASRRRDIRGGINARLVSRTVTCSTCPILRLGFLRSLRTLGRCVTAAYLSVRVRPDPCAIGIRAESSLAPGIARGRLGELDAPSGRLVDRVARGTPLCRPLARRRVTIANDWCSTKCRQLATTTGPTAVARSCNKTARVGWAYDVAAPRHAHPVSNGHYLGRVDRSVMESACARAAAEMSRRAQRFS